MTSETPVRQTTCEGVPIDRYGYAWVLGEAPDLVDQAPMQEGNDAPLRKVRPKKAAEIGMNRLGATTSRMPRTPQNDYLPLEAIHLIDGNPQTCWCSRTQSQPDVEPVWIRLDLPVERTVSAVVLSKRPAGGPPRDGVGSVAPDRGAVEIGRGMPAELTIKLSRDGWHWETVYDGPSGDDPTREECAYRLDPRRAKQIWIIGRGLPRVENWLHAFSIAQVQVLDPAGRNVALATTGAGVTVSSTQHSHGQELAAHRWYWPLHWDSGLKWARVGYHDDPVNWHWVEQARGRLEVDPEADASISELVEHGVNVVMALGFGNRLYTQADPTRRLPQLWEWYYENPAPPTTPEALQAWGRYVRYMAEHYRDRVQHFEIWNEWNIGTYWGAQPSAEHYLAVARVAIPVLRQVSPQAKIMLGSWAGFPHGISGWSAGDLAAKEREVSYLRVAHELAGEVDEIGWHPFYQADPDSPRWRNYAADVRALLRVLADWGFRGHCMATEWNVGANYPPTAGPNWWGDFACSEIEKAKLVAQLHTRHTALGIESFFCEMYHAGYPLDLSLMRRAFAADPIAPLQPQAAYYVTRNLATALEDLQPATFAWRLEAPASVECYPLERSGERVVVLWQPGRPHDACEGVPTNLWVGGQYTRVMGSDPLSGVTQELHSVVQDDGTVVSALLVHDYPLLVRFQG